MTWHVEPDVLERYVAGQLPDAAAWSVESHVSACEACRGHIDDLSPSIAEVAGIDQARFDAMWSQISAGVRATERPLLERFLVRLGVKDHDARLLVATPSLTGSWLLGVALVLAASVAAAWLTRPGEGRGVFVFLLLAPLVPVAGVAVAFGPRVDPTYELGVVAPMRSWRLLLLRSVAVLATSLLLAAIAALALPTAGLAAAAWILPSLALTMAVLASAARVPPWWPDP